MGVSAIQTRALVLRTFAFRESDRLVELLSRDCGLVRAVATSAREERSKLRYALEPYTLSEVTLVRGRDVWRIRGAQSEESFYRDVAKEKTKVMGNILSLLSRLIAGEEQNRELFDELIVLFSTLKQLELGNEELRAFEVIAVLRMLSELGYKIPRPDWQKYLQGSITSDVCQSFLPYRKEAVTLINEVLAQTQL
jgi:DNA repair protein RecO (recombination protein O)